MDVESQNSVEMPTASPVMVRDMDVESQNSVGMPTASPVMVRDMDVESQNSVEMASMPSIQDLQMDDLEDSRINPSRFGQIVITEYTQPDPLMDAQRSNHTRYKYGTCIVLLA